MARRSRKAGTISRRACTCRPRIDPAARISTFRVAVFVFWVRIVRYYADIFRKEAVSTKKRDVGAEVDAFCTKCKIDRRHVIATLKSDGNINKVMCRTCDGTHLFRLPKGDGKKTSAKRPKKGAVVLTAADLAKAKPYAMDAVFKVGNIIQHAKFGPGIVLEVRSDGKMEVGFESGGKTMVCRSAPK